MVSFAHDAQCVMCVIFDVIWILSCAGVFTLANGSFLGIWVCPLLFTVSEPSDAWCKGESMEVHATCSR